MGNKKGELTSKQIITIVILIISFVIILAFFLMLNLKGEIDKEACRNSVSLRGSIPIFKNVISLKCKTQNICFSMGGGCEESTDEIIKIKDDEDDSELTQELIKLKNDCSWMMGEGKIDYGSKGDCAICYKVYFDDKIKEKFKIISPNEQVHTSKVYAVITKIEKNEQTYPKFIEFTSDSLNNMKCSKFVTEV